jgi:hypothetical protein
MVKLFPTIFSPANRKITLTLLILGVLFIIAALIVGVADNPAGITIVFIGIILLMFAFIHFWRSVRAFLILILVSLVGGVVFAILHNFLDALAVRMVDWTLLYAVLEILSATCFIIAVLICPVGVFVGFFGAVVNYFLKQNPKKTAE